MSISKVNLHKLYEYSQEELEEILCSAESKYYNGDEDGLELSDSEFDYIKTYLIEHYPTTEYKKKIGTNESKVNKVDLPVWMGSMDNFKTEKQIENYKKKYKNNYVIMSKLDGISGLIEKNGLRIRLFTRGNGKKGKDISHLLKYLNIPDLSDFSNIIIRGELLIKIKDYKNIKSNTANERSLISGLVNSKEENINKNHIKYLKFVSYELIHPQFEIKEQLKILKKIGMKVVDNIYMENINLNILEKCLVKFKEYSKYLIDGIIIRHNENYEFNKSGNPDYAFAFKMVLNNQIKETIVKKIHWNISKFGKLFPQIEVEKISIGGIDISFISGKSAQYIYNNKLGKGSVIDVIRSCDVIPDIYKIKKESSKAEMPLCNYKWNDNMTDVYSIDDNIENNKEQEIKLITDFFKKIKTENLGPGLVKKLYENNYNSIKKIINIKKENLLEIDGIKDVLANKLLNNIEESLFKCNIIDIMNASNIFGSGFGIKRLENIYYNIDNVLNRTDEKVLLNDIINLNGFNEKTGKQFILYLNKFRKFLKDLNLEYKKEKNIKKKEIKKNIVLTGFRDKIIDNIISEYNIEVNNTINNNTIFVLYKGEKTSSKLEIAKKNNIKILEKDIFLNNIKKYLHLLTFKTPI